MYGFGYSIPSASDLANAQRQAEELARQAQQSAEKAQQIAQQAQQAASQPPVPRPPGPVPVVTEPKRSTAEIFEDYAIPIIAVSAVLGIGLFVWWRKKK